MTAGRPTKFQPEFTQALVEFFDIEPYIKEASEKMTEYYKDGEVKKESEKIRLIPNKMPTLYRFSKKIGVDYSNVWRWAEKGEWDGEGKEPPIEFQQFRNAYKEAKELQKEFLINLGLAGAAPAPFAIFTAKNVTDMRDKQETDITTKGEKFETSVNIGLEALSQHMEKTNRTEYETNPPAEGVSDKQKNPPVA